MYHGIEELSDPMSRKEIPVAAWNETERRIIAEPVVPTPAGTTGDCCAGAPRSFPINDRASVNLSLLYGGFSAKSAIRPCDLVVAQPA